MTQTRKNNALLEEQLERATTEGVGLLERLDESEGRVMELEVEIRQGRSEVSTLEERLEEARVRDEVRGYTATKMQLDEKE